MTQCSQDTSCSKLESPFDFLSIPAARGVFYGVLTAYLAVFFGPELPWKHGVSGGWIFYICGVYLVLFELPIFVLKRTGIYRPDYYTTVPVFFSLDIFMDFMGNLFNLFIVTNYYDVIMHGIFMPLFMASVWFGVFQCLFPRMGVDYTNHKFFGRFVVFAATLMTSSFHEIVEATIDMVTGTNSGTSTLYVWDTGKDMFFVMVGTLIFLFLTRHWAPSEKKL